MSILGPSLALRTGVEDEAGVSTSIASGLGVVGNAWVVGGLRPLKRGLSSDVSPSSTIAAVPMVGLIEGTLDLLGGRWDMGALLAGGGGIKLGGLKVPAQSSWENFVLLGEDSTDDSGSTRACIGFFSLDRDLVGDRPLVRLPDCVRGCRGKPVALCSGAK